MTRWPGPGGLQCFGGERGTMTDIREVLEALGVSWRKGYMACPSCNEEKLTASEKRNVATCWHCGQRWWPGKGQLRALVS